MYLTANEVAEFLRLSVQTIRRYTMKNEIPFHKINRAVRYKKSEIEKWVDGGDMKNTAVENGITDGGLFNEETNGKETP
jgi:excisionase family DNA binding protein